MKLQPILQHIASLKAVIAQFESQFIIAHISDERDKGDDEWSIDRYAPSYPGDDRTLESLPDGIEFYDGTPRIHRPDSGFDYIKLVSEDREALEHFVNENEFTGFAYSGGESVKLRSYAEMLVDRAIQSVKESELLVGIKFFGKYDSVLESIIDDNYKTYRLFYTVYDNECGKRYAYSISFAIKQNICYYAMDIEPIGCKAKIVEGIHKYLREEIGVDNAYLK